MHRVANVPKEECGNVVGDARRLRRSRGARQARVGPPMITPTPKNIPVLPNVNLLFIHDEERMIMSLP